MSFSRLKRFPRDLVLIAVLVGASLCFGLPKLHPSPRANRVFDAPPDLHQPFPRYESLRDYLSGFDLAYYYQDPSWKLPRKAHQFQAQYMVAPTVLRFLHAFPPSPPSARAVGHRPVVLDYPSQADLDAAIERYVARLKAEGRAVEANSLGPGLAILQLHEATE